MVYTRRCPFTQRLYSIKIFAIMLSSKSSSNLSTLRLVSSKQKNDQCPKESDPPNNKPGIARETTIFWVKKVQVDGQTLEIDFNYF
jgi:hypothetical protein